LIPKILYAGWLGLSPAISVQFTLEKRVALKAPIWGVQGHRCWHS